MGCWDYTNVGASAKPENKKYVEKIFEYIGYAAEPDYAPDGEECSFREPDVYCCERSEDGCSGGNIRECFLDMQYEDLLNLLNALFPETDVYVHSAEGNNTSDTWENHDTVYSVDDMTCYRTDSYTDYGGDGPNGNRSSKARFALQTPKTVFVTALIELSKEDGNEALTVLLEELEKRIRDGLIVYKDDPEDKRVIGEKYDVVDDVEDYGYSEEEEDEEDEEPDEEDEECETADEENDRSAFVIQQGVLKKYKGNAEHVIIPDGVTRITSGAFVWKDMNSLVIPEGVTTIDPDAFGSCLYLDLVRFPKTITEIAEGSFYDCNIEKVIGPESMQDVIEEITECDEYETI